MPPDLVARRKNSKLGICRKRNALLRMVPPRTGSRCLSLRARMIDEALTMPP